MGSGPWVRGDDDVHPGCVPRASASDAAQGPRDGQAGAAAHTLGVSQPMTSGSWAKVSLFLK